METPSSLGSKGAVWDSEDRGIERGDEKAQWIVPTGWWSLTTALFGPGLYGQRKEDAKEGEDDMVEDAFMDDVLLVSHSSLRNIV